ncbi:DNA polymerase I [Candidatus Nanosynbacter sp. TM7-008]|uniref:DNA polymerase I n=1 Tax=Candidatus Nanosynbacter sp. TM7-008 TaxID=2902632 RepID=UPI001FB77029|nr:DNA polymerase I [Candidatus Nanosynbacter sp. TM7-008]MCJ1963805.1 DNA polymerase I [Candidatus Nanosynbacter sp. TM7-008]
MKRLVVIDGKSVFYRGYYAMPGLSMADGTPTGGVYGFVSLAIELIKKLEPDYVAVAWDKRGTNIRKRRELYPEYKAGRKPAPDDFYQQIPILHELLDAFGWPLYEIDDYEADDIMGAFARQAESRGIETCLITSDLDALQLISPMTKVYAMKNGLRNIEEFTAEHFEEKYGIRTEQFLDLKALKGDSSDNLPGVPGIGEKTAVKLLQEYETLDGVYEHLDEQKGALRTKLENGRESAYLTKQVAEIWTDAPIELDWDVADVNDCDFTRVTEILQKLEFNSLIGRLPKTMQMAENEKKEEPKLDIPRIEKLPDMPMFEAENIIYIDSSEPDVIYISSNPESVWTAKIDEISQSIWQLLAQGIVIAADVKQLYHALDNHGVAARFHEVWDVGQAAFLIDPLKRDRSLSALSGDFSDDNSAAYRLARLHKIYREQKVYMSNNSQIARVAYEFDFPVIWALFQMEKRGMKLDDTLLKQMGDELAAEVGELEQQMYSMAGYEFNASSPAQLSEVLFTKLQLPTAGIKKGKTGYSTGQKELDKLRGQHPIIELIERYRELTKLISTYIEALPKLMATDGRIHTTFNQDVTSTGRLSSTNPNLQNIPVRTELGRKIRQAFVPSDGKVFVGADYSQFELRLAAVLAGDEKLIEDFNSDVDIHAKTAAETYGISIDEVSKSQRRAAKVINFGVLYGMSPHGLAAATGMSFTEAKKFIDHYFEVRKPIRQYLDKILTQAREQGFVETYFGRRRPTPDIKSSNFMVRSSAERAAMNMPIQGTEADLMKLAMIRLEDKLSGLADAILQVHDSILVECKPEDVQEVSEIMKAEMEGVCPELPIKLKVDVGTGVNWGEV